MKITTHIPNDDGVIVIENCISIVLMGIRDDQPTIWAITDTDKGDTLEIIAKYEDDEVTFEELGGYRGSVMNSSVAWHLFTKPVPKPKPIVKDGKSIPGKEA